MKRYLSVAAAAALLGALLAGCVADGGSSRSYPVASSYGSGYSHASGPPLHISDASYHAAGGRHCDPVNRLRRECEGGHRCEIDANNRLCGDPAKGLGKELVVGYKCGGGRLEIRVPEGRSAVLSCR
jgi:hypothetical protein